MDATSIVNPIASIITPRCTAVHVQGELWRLRCDLRDRAGATPRDIFGAHFRSGPALAETIANPGAHFRAYLDSHEKAAKRMAEVIAEQDRRANAERMH